jgi:hypothetical protein
VAHDIDRKRYRLTHHTEEFQCPTCGVPVYVGDLAVQPDHDREPFCSWYCAGGGEKPSAELSRQTRAGQSTANLFDGVA